MTSPIMMHVYFDTEGNIKSISPSADLTLEATHKTAMISIDEVEPFLSSKKNIFDFHVKEVDAKHRIQKKPNAIISQIRSIDNYLTEIKLQKLTIDTIILIENYISDKKVKIKITPELKILQEKGTEEEQLSINSFINSSYSSLFFTRKHDPYFLIHTVTFSPRLLFENEELIMTHTKNLENLSVFTKRIISKYAYTEKP